MTLLAGLYGKARALLKPSGATPQDAIADELAMSEGELFTSAMRDVTKLPIAATDRADLPAPLAVRAAAEAVLAAIDRSGRTPPDEVRKWAPMAGADLALLLVARPEVKPDTFDRLWRHYADDMPALRQIAEGASPVAGPPGASTFTIEGRSAPALFVIGWLASLLGLGTILIALLAGGGGAAPFVLIGGLLLLGTGLVAGAGSQGIERRARGLLAYAGPSPLLVFAASIPTSFLAVIAIGVPLSIAGVAVDGPFGRLASVTAQALVYVALIRLLVVDARALGWADMGVRRPDRAAIRELAGGALWAVPVIVLTIPVAVVLSAIFPVEPVSPLPPAGEPTGLILNLLAGAIVAPIGEELMFRGFATTAWARGLGPRRALVRGALFFAVVHVLTISGGTAGEAVGQAIIGFASRVPVALALGWLFLRSGSIYTPIGLHATFNAILLLLGEAALQSGA